ncbi:cbb3-type cytochrome oxidase assembly protein CcoS [Ancylomarina sp. DW003]|nr:cbb3-type cytochrome oxidase assembly protein CcoS [Ancylomarina sp. DW003]MDE5420860.1 cbb3-type cytochrome oxidase assembly protein CcoS [Ancylomarina sp. DW003]
MSVIFVLIAVSMVVAGGFLIGFLWAVKKGQYEDTYSPSVRILFDDQEIKDQEESKTKDIKEDESKSSEEK